MASGGNPSDFGTSKKLKPLILGFSSNSDHLGLNWFILHKFLRNSAFTRQVGLIIASSRSGMSFCSCLASSTYFSITKKCVFLRVNFLFVSRPMADYPLQPISGPCSIEKYPSSRMANRYTRIFDAGGPVKPFYASISDHLAPSQPAPRKK